jgi:tetratricopeptide (TPR) repeat protein
LRSGCGHCVPRVDAIVPLTYPAPAPYRAPHQATIASGLYYAQGVAAGERALGKERFERDAGHFWGILETRPYMRARAGLASCLRTEGRRQEAIEHWADMLRLNPGDNQGIRYVLLAALLEAGDDARIEALLKGYRADPAASWAYGRPLVAFRTRDDTAPAQWSVP